MCHIISLEKIGGRIEDTRGIIGEAQKTCYIISLNTVGSYNLN
jgi:hypothetical protein